MANLNVTLSITDVPGLLDKLRLEVASVIREAAQAETDPTVIARLMQIAARFSQDLSAVEAAERMKNPPEHTGLPHRGGRPRLDAIGGAGSKVSGQGWSQGANAPKKE